MKSSGKRKYSAVETAASSETAITEQDAKKKCQNQSSVIDCVKNDKKDPSVNEPSTSGEERPSADTDTSTAYECPICLELTEVKEIKTLPCSHIFHQACIDMWLKSSGRCPVCRKETIDEMLFLRLEELLGSMKELLKLYKRMSSSFN